MIDFDTENAKWTSCGMRKNGNTHIHLDVDGKSCSVVLSQTSALKLANTILKQYLRMAEKGT